MSAFHSAETLLQGAHQVHAAAHIGHAYHGLTANPSAQTAWDFGGKLVGVIGTERVVGQLVKFGVKAAIKAHGVDQSAAQQMVETMKSRAPVDTGRLLNGISYTESDGLFTVEASAARDGDADYARFVEFGHGDTPAAPFFWNSAKDTLHEWGSELSQVIDASATEEGLR